MTAKAVQWNHPDYNVPGLTGFMVAALVEFSGVNSIQFKDGNIMFTLVMKTVPEAEQAQLLQLLQQYQGVLRQCLETEFNLPAVAWEDVTGFSRAVLSWSLEQFVPKQVQLVLETIWDRFAAYLLTDEYYPEGDEITIQEGFLEEQLAGAQWNPAETLIAYREGGRVLVYTVPARG